MRLSFDTRIRVCVFVRTRAHLRGECILSLFGVHSQNKTETQSGAGNGFGMLPWFVHELGRRKGGSDVSGCLLELDVVEKKAGSSKSLIARQQRVKEILASVKIDASKPRSQRPMMGYDIEQWRGETGLSKFRAQAALGFRNANHYNKMCMEPVIPESIEIIIRLYEENPVAPGWEKFTLLELFDLMYAKALRVFDNTPDALRAYVDLGNRFTKLFNRSSSRKYNWLRDDNMSEEREFGGAYSDVETILTLLKQTENPAEVLERVAKKVFLLRGVNLDEMYPIPTLENPPRRERTGRKPSDKSRAKAAAKADKLKQE